MVRLDTAYNYEHNVVSSSIFGKADHSDDPNCNDKIYEDKYTRVGYIDLTCRVLNPFLAGRGAPVWRTVLGLSSDMISGIINGNVVYDNEVGAMVSNADIGTSMFDRERYVFGAELLVKLLDEVDVWDSLCNKLIGTYVVPVLSKDEKAAYEAGTLNLGPIVTVDPEDIISGRVSIENGWLFGTYFIDLESGDLPEDRIDDVYAKMLDNTENYDITNMQQFPILSLLSSMIDGDGKEALKSQILSYIFVLPEGYRPTIDGRVDVITSQYNKLVNANSELRDILEQQQNATCYAVLNKYREVVQYIRNIFIGDDQVIQQQRLKDYKSISDTITGKEGLMRGRMQGVRIDYSGRTVITCDPEMPIDTIGIPWSMLYKIAEPSVIQWLRNEAPDLSKKVTKKNLARLSTSTKTDVDGLVYKDLLKRWLEYEPRFGPTGRQPTLFYLGIEAFKIKPVDGDAIVLSPLVVMPFNADFDGDQMHFNMAQTAEANKEIRERMSFTNNYRYPKNGEITIVMRHEIIYGLWMCSTATANTKSRNLSQADVNNIAKSMGLPQNNGHGKNIYDAVCKQKINIYDNVETPFGTQTAGIAALEYAIYCGFNTQDLTTVLKGKGIKAKQITSILENAYSNNKTFFLNAINRLVKLGFRVAKIWPPNISTIVSSTVKEHVKQLIDDFNKDVLEREEYVNIGIEIESEYSNYFNKRWNELRDEVIDYLVNNLGDDNGYIAMMKSGGKGDKNNIMQIFGLKGRVQKNDTTAFNSIIAGCYSGHLTGLEGFITAYGSRKGIADKVLATADPGYMSRKLEHAGAIMSVFSEDCETTEGMQFSLEDIVPFLDDSQISRYGVRVPNASKQVVDAFRNSSEYKTQLLAAREYLSKIIVGRWCIDRTSQDSRSVFIPNINAAYQHIDKSWGYINPKTHEFVETGDGIVEMRSPVYCKCPVCKKCYGRDIAAGTDEPQLGRPVGFIAAQAIGEPGTQLTMKNFQKGGVVTDANLTSSFQLIEDYFELHDFSKRKSKRGVLTYDMISPVDGKIREQYLGNGTKRIFIIPDNPEDRIVKSRMRSLAVKKIIVHAQTKLKDHVYEGDSFQKIQGNLNMKEVLRYRGFDKAASYLALKLYDTFMTQDVNFKHFETIVASMSVCYLWADANNVYDYKSLHTGEKTYYKAGSVLTWPEACNDVNGQQLSMRTLLGLKALPKYKNDFFESVLMENMDTYVPRAILMNPNDSMSNPITRAAFGLRIGIGSDVES
jgi:DNA-directed RNA polymerase subunit beta'